MGRETMTFSTSCKFFDLLCFFKVSFGELKIVLSDSVNHRVNLYVLVSNHRSSANFSLCSLYVCVCAVNFPLTSCIHRYFTVGTSIIGIHIEKGFARS